MSPILPFRQQQQQPAAPAPTPTPTRNRFSILVADDLTAESQPVRNYASGLAEMLGVPIELVHVEESPRHPEPDVNFGRSVEGENSQVGRQLNETARAMKGDVRPLLVRGSPVSRAITQISRRDHPGLIAMGTHGRTGLHRWIFGSVAEGVLRTANVPVLTVGPKAKPFDLDLDALKNRTTTLRILVATDLGKNSQRAEACGLVLAQRLGAKVILLHSLREGLHPVLESALEDASETNELGDVADQLRTTALRRLVFREKQFQRRGVSCVSVLDDGAESAAQAIENEVIRSGVHLVVTGTHGKKRIEEAFFGSTARKTIADAPVPVITVRSRAA